MSFRVKHVLNRLRLDGNASAKPVISNGIKLMILLASLAQDILLWYLSECDAESEVSETKAKKFGQIPIRLRKVKRSVNEFSKSADAVLDDGSFGACSKSQTGAKSISLIRSRQELLREEAIAVSKTVNILPANHTKFSINVRVCVDFSAPYRRLPSYFYFVGGYRFLSSVPHAFQLEWVILWPTLA